MFGPAHLFSFHLTHLRDLLPRLNTLSNQYNLSNQTHLYLKIHHSQLTRSSVQLSKMVQGLPAVDWKDAKNNAKLFAAVLALIPGTPDYKKIASVFGEFIPIVATLDHQQQFSFGSNPVL